VLWDATVVVADFNGFEIVENKEVIGCLRNPVDGPVVKIIDAKINQLLRNSQNIENR